MWERKSKRKRIEILVVVIVIILAELILAILNVYQRISLKRTIFAGILLLASLSVFHIIWIKHIGNCTLLNKSGDRKFRWIFVGYMYLQCILGICWACTNVFFVPEFGDTSYYLVMSETLQRSSIRYILYPLLIRVCKLFEMVTRVDYQFFLYMLQFFVAFCSNWYLVKTVKRGVTHECKESDIWIYALFLTFLPQVMEFHFSVLTDSLACSALVVVTAIGVLWLYEGKLTRIELIIGMTAVATSIMLRYERKMLCTVFFLCIALVIVKFRENRKNILKYLAVLCVLPILLTSIINYNTSVLASDSGVHAQSVSLRLLAKFGIGNMEINYDNFPEEVRQYLSLETAEDLDAGNLKPGQVLLLLEDEIGVAKTNEFVYEITYIVLKNSFGKEMLEIVKDWLLYANPLIFGVIELNGVHVGGIDWNYGRMVMNTPAISKVYYNFSMYLGVMLLLGITVYLLWNERNILRGKFRIWGGIGIVGFLLVSLFGIVNSSRPNDRYVLIIYIFWYLLLLFEAEEVQTMKRDDRVQQCIA